MKHEKWTFRKCPKDNDNAHFSHWIDREDMSPVADIRDHPRSEEIARLIAAAPALLEALENLVEIDEYNLLVQRDIRNKAKKLIKELE